MKSMGWLNLRRYALWLQKTPVTLVLIESLRYYQFYVVLIWSLEIKTSLFFTLIIILIEISSINYMILAKCKKI